MKGLLLSLLVSLSMNVKVSGAWKTIIDPQVRVSSVWKQINSGWVRVSGVWKNFYVRLPAGLIGFFSSAPGTGWQTCDGSGSTPNLHQIFPKGYTSQGTPDASTANQHQHDTYSGSSGGAQTSGYISGTDGDRWANHTHSIAHTHSSIDHIPLAYELIPASLAGAASIPTSFVAFFESVPTGWTAYAASYGRFLRGNTSAAGGTPGASTHTHSFSGSTAAGGSGVTARYSGTGYNSHTHDLTHSHAAKTNDPPWIQLIPARPDAPLTTLPSGTICFFLGSTVPSGWSVYSAAQGKFIKMNSTADTTGAGTSTHTHASDTINTGNYTNTTGGGSSAASTVPASTHLHSASHGHGDAKNWEPAKCQLLICKKD